MQAVEVELSTQDLPGRGAVGHLGARLNVGQDVPSNTREGLLKCCSSITVVDSAEVMKQMQNWCWSISSQAK